MPPVKKTVKLEDLSVEDRARLLKEHQAGASTEALAAAQATMSAWNARLRPRDHLADCPVALAVDRGDDDVEIRVEAYAATVPANPDKAIPALPVTVVRCITCGGHRRIDEPYTDVAAQVATEVEQAATAA